LTDLFWPWRGSLRLEIAGTSAFLRQHDEAIKPVRILADGVGHCHRAVGENKFYREEFCQRRKPRSNAPSAPKANSLGSGTDVGENWISSKLKIFSFEGNVPPVVA